MSFVARRFSAAVKVFRYSLQLVGAELLVYDLPDNFVGRHFGYWARLNAAGPNFGRVFCMEVKVDVCRKKCCCGKLPRDPYR